MAQQDPYAEFRKQIGPDPYGEFRTDESATSTAMPSETPAPKTLNDKFWDALKNVARGQMMPGAQTGFEPTGNRALDFARGAMMTAAPGGPAAISSLGFGEQLYQSPLVQTGLAVGQKAKDVFNRLVGTPAQNFNVIGGVPAGPKGAETSFQTGLPKTEPGNAPVRILQEQGYSPFSIRYKSLFSRPTPALQQQVTEHLGRTGESIGEALAASPEHFDFSYLPQGNWRIDQAMRAADVTPQELSNLNAAQAGRLRSELGHKVNFNPLASNEANDIAKDAWQSMSGDLNRVPGLAGPQGLNKVYQEDLLFARANQQRLNDILQSGR